MKTCSKCGAVVLQPVEAECLRCGGALVPPPDIRAAIAGPPSGASMVDEALKAADEQIRKDAEEIVKAAEEFARGQSPVSGKPSKMYILIWDGMDVGHAVNTAAHAGAMIASKWPVEVYDGAGPVVWDPDMKEWYDLSFRKVTCKVTREEMEQAKASGLEHFVVTESAYGGQEVALVFKPRKEWPKLFKGLKLYN